MSDWETYKLGRYNERELRKIRDAIDKHLEIGEYHIHKSEKTYEYSGSCACGYATGWWCPDSPDNACHYFTMPDGGVLDINNNRIEVPEGHDYSNEEYDWCIYCGQPDERK
jgi:hypothetical protein